MRRFEFKQEVLYLALHQHGDVDEHVVQLLDAALQTDDVFVSGFDFAQCLFGNSRVDNLRREGDFLFVCSPIIAALRYKMLGSVEISTNH